MYDTVAAHSRTCIGQDERTGVITRVSYMKTPTDTLLHKMERMGIVERNQEEGTTFW